VKIYTVQEKWRNDIKATKERLDEVLDTCELNQLTVSYVSPQAAMEQSIWLISLRVAAVTGSWDLSIKIICAASTKRYLI
jgi:hypothetical protein